MTGRANVLASMWEDEEFLGLTPTSKILWLYLLTGPHMKLSAGGLACVQMEVLVAMLKRQFGNKMSVNTVRNSLKDLSTPGFCCYEESSGLLLIFGWLKHNKPQSPKNIVGWVDNVCAMRQSPVINDWLEILKEHCIKRGTSFQDVFDDRFKHLYVAAKVLKKIEAGQEPLSLFSATITTPKKKMPAWTMKCARRMAEHLKDVTPRTPRAQDLERWADAFDKLHRIDKYSKNDIGHVLDWTYTDPFWAGVILSGTNFRKHFPRLLQGTNEQSKNGREDADPFAAMRGATT